MNYEADHHVQSLLTTPASGDVQEGQEQERFRQKISQFILMRSIAIGMEILFIYLVLGPLSLLQPDVTTPLIALVGGQMVFNIGAYVVLRQEAMGVRQQLFLQVGGDLLLLTGLLHYSGGVENPFVFLYLIHVILASILFQPYEAYGIAAASIALVTGLAIGEYSGVLPHHDLLIHPHSDVMNPARNPFYVGGMLITLSLLIVLISYFATAVMAQLRESRSDVLEHARNVTRAKKRFESVLTASGAGVLVFDPDHNLIWANDQIKRWFPNVDFTPGQPCPHLNEQKCSLFPSEDVDSDDDLSKENCERCSVLETMKQKKGRKWEQVHVSSGDQKRYLQFITNPILNEDGEIEQIVELVHDVTGRKQMEQQIEHQERMSSLGRLASGIMHEIGNPLSSISARLRRLKEKTDEEFTLETVQFLDNQISRLNRLIREISSFAQAPEPTLTTCRVDQLMDEVITLLELDKNSNDVEIVTDYRDQSPFLASEDQLSQVFLNLGLNALEAMPDGGTLTISSWQEQDRVYFSFSDTGKGIPPEEQDDIFTPYYSSGKREDGTGLGLSIVHSFVEAHGGEVEVNSVPGEGATFTVWIPYHDPNAEFSQISNLETTESTI